MYRRSVTILVAATCAVLALVVLVACKAVRRDHVRLLADEHHVRTGQIFSLRVMVNDVGDLYAAVRHRYDSEYFEFVGVLDGDLLGRTRLRSIACRPCSRPAADRLAQRAALTRLGRDEV